MEKIAKVLADCIYRSESEFSIEVYQYALQVALEMLTVVLASCVIAIYLDMKLEYCLFLAEFTVLRSYAGGLHFSGFKECFFCSFVIITGTLLFVKTYTIPPIMLCVLMGVFTIAFSVTKPVNSKNKTITDEESEHYKKKLETCLICLCAVFVLTLIAGLARYANLIVVTTIITFGMMLVGKWKEEYESKEK